MTGNAQRKAQMLATRACAHLWMPCGNEQNQLTGRLGALAENQQAHQGELTRTMTEQLGQVTKNVTDNLTESREKTAKSLGDLGERLSLD